ncbi:MAG: hypothetical protein AB1546_06370, partial [bacterium]
CLMIGGVYFLIPLIIQYPLKEYIPAFAVAPILLLGSYFLSIRMPIEYFIISINRIFVLIMFLGICALFNFSLSYYFIAHGFGIRGVAYGTSLSYSIFGMMVMIYWLAHCHDSVKAIIGDVCRIFLPLAYTILCISAVNLIFPPDKTSLWYDIALTTVRIVMFCILALPLIIYINSQTKVIQLVLNALTTRLKRFILRNQ